MLSHTDSIIAGHLKERLQPIISLKRMVVYGSRARGDASHESDMDVFIEASSVTPEQRRQISEAAWEISLDHGVIITTYVGSSAEVESGMMSANPIMRAIEHEGIAI